MEIFGIEKTLVGQMEDNKTQSSFSESLSTLPSLLPFGQKKTYSTKT